VICLLEPVISNITAKESSGKSLSSFRLSIFGRKKQSSYYSFLPSVQEFFLPSECFGLMPLKSKVAILCERGFEIMNITGFQSVLIPTCEDPEQASLAKRCSRSRPLGMFRTNEGDFLLCYDGFGLYVDLKGDPLPSRDVIEWAETASHVSFQSPYVVVFTAESIQIRDIEKECQVVQIISRKGMRCTWDGLGVSGGEPGSGGVHVAVGGGGPGIQDDVAQRVFELVRVDSPVQAGSV